MTADFTPATAEHELVRKARSAGGAARTLEMHYAADTLAECADHLEWLYGYEPSEYVGHCGKWNAFPFVRVTPEGDIVVGPNSGEKYGLTRAESIEFASALLAAAEETRDA